MLYLNSTAGVGVIVSVQTKKCSRLRSQFNISQSLNPVVKEHVRLGQQGQRMLVHLWQHFQTLLLIPK